LNFGQFSLNLKHCAAPQTDVEPRYPGPDCTTRAVRFVLSKLVHNCYTWKLKAGRNKKSLPPQPGTHLINFCCLKSDSGT